MLFESLSCHSSTVVFRVQTHGSDYRHRGDTDFTVLYTGEDRTAAFVLVSNVRDTMINQHGTGDTCRGAPPRSSRLVSHSHTVCATTEPNHAQCGTGGTNNVYRHHRGVGCPGGGKFTYLSAITVTRRCAVHAHVEDTPHVLLGSSFCLRVLNSCGRLMNTTALPSSGSGRSRRHPSWRPQSPVCP